MSEQEGGILDHYVLFPNHHEGLLLHQKLKELDIRAVIVPTPREARNFCGICLKVAPENLPQVEKVVADEEILIDGIISLARKKTFGYKSC